MWKKQVKLTVWETKFLPPKPSTVSDISVAAQNIIATLERNWEQNCLKLGTTSRRNHIVVQAAVPRVPTSRYSQIPSSSYAVSTRDSHPSPYFATPPCSPYSFDIQSAPHQGITGGRIMRPTDHDTANTFTLATASKAISGTLPYDIPAQESLALLTQGTSSTQRSILSSAEMSSNRRGTDVLDLEEQNRESPCLDFSDDDEGLLLQSITQSTQDIFSQHHIPAKKKTNVAEYEGSKSLETIDLTLETTADEQTFNNYESSVIDLNDQYKDRKFLQHITDITLDSCIQRNVAASKGKKVAENVEYSILETIDPSQEMEIEDKDREDNRKILPVIGKCDIRKQGKKRQHETLKDTSNPIINNVSQEALSCELNEASNEQNNHHKSIHQQLQILATKNHNVLAKQMQFTSRKNISQKAKSMLVSQILNDAEQPAESVVLTLNKKCINSIYDKKSTENGKELETSSLPKMKKGKYKAPYKSQDSSTTCISKEHSTSIVNEDMNVTSLQHHNIENVIKQIISQPPIEICITLLFENNSSQLSISNSSTSTKHINVNRAPNGLMLAVLEENKPVEFYHLSLDMSQNNKNNLSVNIIRTFLQNTFLTSCRKICFKTQQLFSVLIHKLDFNYHEVALKWVVIDPLIGCWLLNPDSPPQDFNQVLTILQINRTKTIFKQTQSRICNDLVLLSKAAETMYHQLINRRLWRVFLDLESPIVSMLAAMEMRGILVDSNKLKETGTILETRLKLLQSEANKVTGVPVLLTSPQQLRRILFDQLKLDAKLNIPLTEQKGGKSTSESVLKLLTSLHPLPGIILEYRHLQKLKSTYVDGILLYVQRGQLKPLWEQTSAATGRLVSRDPNIQAFPRQPVILNDNGMPQQKIWLRSAFVCREDFSFVAADFQHIELRLFAHFAQDTALIALLMQTEEDVFETLTRQWLGYSKDKAITSEDREKTKRVVYAVMYGAGVNKLEQVLQVDTNEARRILNTFTKKFPQIKNFSQKLIIRARNQGYIASLSGRRRLFPNIFSPDAKLRSQSERQAVNFLIQGSAADVCKAAMIRTEQAQQKCLPKPLQAELTLQIHDELVWEVPDSQMHQFKDIVQEAMEDTRTQFNITLPLPVTLTNGKTWADLVQ